MNVDRALGTMFMLIFVFILVSRSDEASQLIRAMGGFITNQTKALQGVGFANFDTLVR